MKDEYDQYKNAESFIENKGLKVKEVEKYQVDIDILSCRKVLAFLKYQVM